MFIASIYFMVCDWHNDIYGEQTVSHSLSLYSACMKIYLYYTRVYLCGPTEQKLAIFVHSANFILLFLSFFTVNKEYTAKVSALLLS